MKETSDRGVWKIEDTVTEELGTEQVDRGDGTSYGVNRAALHLGGQPHLRARNQAIAALFKVKPAISDGKQTLLVIQETGSVTAIEGRPTGGTRPGFLRKGATRSGYYLDRLTVLASLPGYKPERIEAAWNTMKTQVPELGKFDFDGIPERNEDEDGIAENTELIQAVFIGTHPGFGSDGECRAAGCMWLITDKQTDEDNPDHTILNGYFWCPEGSELTSEHGSVYASHLERWAGRVKDFQPGTLTFRQCVYEEIPGDPAEAYHWVTRVPVPA